MKVLLFLGASLLSFASMAQTQTAAPAEKKQESPLVWKTMVIERKDIPYDSKEPFIFEFKNTGKENAMVTNVATSCGCTKAEQPTEPVAKGKSSRIVVNYDTKRVGNFTKTITVTTNVSPDPIILTIKGNVLAAPTTTPATPAPTQEMH